MTDARFYATKMTPLVGSTIVETFVGEWGMDYPFEEPMWGFQVKTPDGKMFDVWVNRDSEGNGSGAVDIQPVEE